MHSFVASCLMRRNVKTGRRKMLFALGSRNLNSSSLTLDVIFLIRFPLRKKNTFNLLSVHFVIKGLESVDLLDLTAATTARALTTHCWIICTECSERLHTHQGKKSEVKMSSLSQNASNAKKTTTIAINSQSNVLIEGSYCILLNMLAKTTGDKKKRWLQV